MPTEPVIVTVSQVRAAIAAAEPPRQSAPVTALTGSLFHLVAARLLSSNHPGSWQRMPPDAIESPEAIQLHVYHTILGPALERSRAALQGGAADVLYLWRAVQSLSSWLSGVLCAARDQHQIRYDPERECWQVAANFAAAECPLVWNLREKDWNAPVRVEGRLDALIGHPAGQSWCVVEYKLSRGPSLADLGQVCLYREMLADGTGEDGAIALVRFGEDLEESLHAGSSLTEVRQSLIRLIGALAGVDNRAQAAPQSDAPAYEELGRRLVKALAELGAPARLAGPVVAGPAFLRFPLVPERGVRSSAILKQGQELQVRLSLNVQPLLQISESGQVVADIPRPDRQTVLFGDVAGQIPPPDQTGAGTHLPVGVNLDGRLCCADLSATPHVLVAGTTGGGKSEWLRMALAGLLMRNTPQSLRVVCIDPKMNAFGDMKRSPFLWTPHSLVYPPADSALNALDELVSEMTRRQALFERAGADDIRQFTAKTGEPLPRIVCFCDEYANLIGTRQERAAVEDQIGRLGSMGRSSGIHLIVATQQPSRKVVGGALQTNMPCRVALLTKSAIESRMLLEESGAENLLGRGDLLYWDIGRPVRLQAPYLPEDDRKRLFSGE